MDDSGLGKSLDKQDLTLEDTKDKEKKKDSSHEEPTVINETQTLSQEDALGDTHVESEIFPEDLQHVLLPEPSGGVDDKGQKKSLADGEDGDSSAPFIKKSKKTAGKVSAMPFKLSQDRCECS